PEITLYILLLLLLHPMQRVRMLFFLRLPSFYYFYQIHYPLLPLTLFPYTTLFRSVHIDVARLRQLAALGDGLADHLEGILVVRDIDSQVGLQGRIAAIVLGDGDDTRILGELLRDRKSPRLHSSHVSISSAVFCLKKTSTQA